MGMGMIMWPSISEYHKLLLTYNNILDSLISYKPARTLRSSSSDLRIVPHRVKTVIASRAFRVAAPTIWNNLPDFVE